MIRPLLSAFPSHRPGRAAVLLATVGALACSLLGSTSAQAQENIELGALRDDQPVRRRPERNSSGLRFGMQLRLDALNSLGLTGYGPSATGSLGRRLLVPLVAPGLRLADDKLFLGLGLGFQGWSTEAGNGEEESRSGFSLSPMIAFDLLRDGYAALSLNGALHLASIGETETCLANGTCSQANDDASGIGLSLGVGVRGLLLPGLALGADFGWGFMNMSADAGLDVFAHGLFGALMLEATIGI